MGTKINLKQATNWKLIVSVCVLRTRGLPKKRLKQQKMKI